MANLYLSNLFILHIACILNMDEFMSHTATYGILEIVILSDVKVEVQSKAN